MKLEWSKIDDKTYGIDINNYLLFIEMDDFKYPSHFDGSINHKYDWVLKFINLKSGESGQMPLMLMNYGSYMGHRIGHQDISIGEHRIERAFEIFEAYILPKILYGITLLKIKEVA